MANAPEIVVYVSKTPHGYVAYFEYSKDNYIFFVQGLYKRSETIINEIFKFAEYRGLVPVIKGFEKQERIEQVDEREIDDMVDFDAHDAKSLLVSAIIPKLNELIRNYNQKI